MKKTSDKLVIDFKRGLKSPDNKVRKETLRTIARGNVDAVVYGDIMSLAQEDPDAEVRYLARRALNSFNQANRPTLDSARNLIRELLRNKGDKRKEVYQRVFTSNDSFLKKELLRQLTRDKQALENKEVLAEILRSQISREKDSALMPSYITALGIFGTLKDITLLQKFLQSSNPRVVANSIEALAALEDPMAMNMVLKHLHHDDNRVRANAITLIHKFDPERAQEEIKKISVSEKLWMRSSALYCLLKLQIPDQLEIAGSMAEKETDPELLNSLIQLLLSVGDMKSAESLARRSVTEQNGYFLNSIDGALRVLSQKLQFDVEELKRVVEDSLSVETNEEIVGDSKKKPKAVTKEQKKTSIKKKTWANSITILAIGLSVIFIFLRLGWDVGIVKKTYSLDPFTMKQAISTDQYLKYLNAEFLRGKGNCKEALMEYESLVKEKKDSIPYLRGKGLCLVVTGETERARQILEEVVRKNPRDPLALNALIDIYIQQKEPQTMISAAFEKALSLSPRNLELRQKYEKFRMISPQK